MSAKTKYEKKWQDKYGKYKYILSVANAVVCRDFPYRRDPYVRAHLKRFIASYREAQLAMASAEPHRYTNKG